MGVNAPLNRKLRMGLVGGGQGAFIGRVHATAAIMDNQAVLVAGALSSDPAKAKDRAPDYDIKPERAYGSYQSALGERAAGSSTWKWHLGEGNGRGILPGYSATVAECSCRRNRNRYPHLRRRGRVFCHSANNVCLPSAGKSARRSAWHMGSFFAGSRPTKKTG